MKTTTTTIRLSPPRGRPARRTPKSARPVTAVVNLPQLPPVLLSAAKPQAADVNLDYADTRSAYQLYLREIGQTKLLTAQEEIALAKRIKKGDAKAREEMISANLRLVVKIARDYEGYGVPLLDLISEGNIGLIKAVERFDPTKGAKFSTYGAFWIKQAIRTGLSNQSKTIRLPIHVVEKLGQLRRAENKFFDEFGREPTNEELAGESGMAARRVQQYRKAAVTPMSLDAPVGEDDSNRIADVIRDEKTATPYEQLQGETDARMLRELLETLSPREKIILQLRFGLGDAEKLTLGEVGAKLGLTRERIRQIQESALKRLKKRIDALEVSRHPSWPSQN